MEADAVLVEIEKLSQRRFLPIIGPTKGKYLIDAVMRFKARRVLEIETLVGYSAILIAKNLPADGKVLTIEINPRSAKLTRENIRRANLSDRVEVFIGDARAVIPKLEEEFDMVFLDGSKEEYLDYLKLSEKKLKTGGVVFADNVKIFANRMRDYLDYVRNSGEYKSEYLDAGFDGVEVSIKLNSAEPS